jgi:hypothetical protein
MKKGLAAFVERKRSLTSVHTQKRGQTSAENYLRTLQRRVDYLVSMGSRVSDGSLDLGLHRVSIKVRRFNGIQGRLEDEQTFSNMDSSDDSFHVGNSCASGVSVQTRNQSTMTEAYLYEEWFRDPQAALDSSGWTLEDAAVLRVFVGDKGVICAVVGLPKYVRLWLTDEEVETLYQERRVFSKLNRNFSRTHYLEMKPKPVMCGRVADDSAYVKNGCRYCHFCDVHISVLRCTVPEAGSSLSLASYTPLRVQQEHASLALDTLPPRRYRNKS